MKIFMADTQEKGKARQREIAREREKGTGRAAVWGKKARRKLAHSQMAKSKQINKHTRYGSVSVRVHECVCVCLYIYVCVCVHKCACVLCQHILDVVCRAIFLSAC